jgi:hypothetical protein
MDSAICGTLTTVSAAVKVSHLLCTSMLLGTDRRCATALCSRAEVVRAVQDVWADVSKASCNSLAAHTSKPGPEGRTRTPWRRQSSCARQAVCSQREHLRAGRGQSAWRMADDGDTAGQT